MTHEEIETLMWNDPPESEFRLGKIFWLFVLALALLLCVPAGAQTTTPSPSCGAGYSRTSPDAPCTHQVNDGCNTTTYTEGFERYGGVSTAMACPDPLSLYSVWSDGSSMITIPPTPIFGDTPTFSRKVLGPTQYMTITAPVKHYVCSLKHGKMGGFTVTCRRKR